MTDLQKLQFNRMRAALRRIALDYLTPDQLRQEAEVQYGIEFAEVLEITYDNIQEEAKAAVKGVRALR